MTKLILGILGVIAGIVLGVYVGLWLCFIGGIIGIAKVVMALLAGKLLVGTLAWSVFKIVIAGIAGWISASILILPSWAMIASAK